MKRLSSLTVLLSTGLLYAALGAQALKAAPAATNVRPNTDGLSAEESAQRAARISDTKYRMHFSLDGKAKDFTGEVEISFNLKEAAKPLTVDFGGGKVKSLEINGKAASKIIYNGHFLTVSGIPETPGAKTTLKIKFSAPYSTNGRGLYRFKDPEDKKTYLYTDFEPYFANALFPCFDQPDLKATYTVTVDAPAAWTVVSSERENKIEDAKAQRKIWSFPETLAFSTYLFSLHAGDYKVWESKAESIPLRLFARHSVAKYIDVDEWFTITRQGLAFYQKYFDFAYPFHKYDQLIVPDFNAGAMENVAAVTFSERYFPRGVATENERENRADVILHEMAHQWFGDLVTMRWWNDLWLNESFATYMAALASHDATEFKKSWLTFYTGTKQWAYFEDQLVTTHPIEGVVPDTEHAFASFDGITYGKGASVLKLLSFHLGPEKFQAGVQAYFKKNQFNNAELKDFMGSLSTASEKDLNQWSDQWLRTAGLNTVEAKFECKDKKISQFALHQSAPSDYPTLRTHSAEIGLYDDTPQGITLRKSIRVTYANAVTELPALKGEACPAMVYPNQQDHDFVKVRLDPATLALTKNNLPKIADPLLRAMMWTSMWDMVRDAEIPLNDYAEVILKNIGSEPELKIQTKVLQTVYGRRRSNTSLINYLASEGQGAAARDALVRRFESLFSDQFNAAVAGTDAQKLWFDSLVRVAESPEASTKLEGFLAAKNDAKNAKAFDVDQDRRWAIVTQLLATDTEGKKKFDDLLKAESKRDPSNAGVQAGIEAEAGRPLAKVKAKWYKEIIASKTKRSFAEIKAALRSLFPAKQVQLKREYADKYYSQLGASTFNKRDRDWQRSFADSSLLPAMCEEKSAADLGKFIDAHPELSPSVVKALKVARQEDDRCVRVRANANGVKKQSH